MLGTIVIEHCFVHLSLLFLKLCGSKWIFGFVCSQTFYIFSTAFTYVFTSFILFKNYLYAFIIYFSIVVAKSWKIGPSGMPQPLNTSWLQNIIWTY